MEDVMKKVKPLAEKIYDEAKEDGLTLKEFRTLAGLLTTMAHGIQEDRNNMALAEKL